MNLLYSENPEIIIDDEKYFCFSNDEIPGNSGFYTNDINKCPDKVRFKGKEKFPKKILVWVALSSRGISEPLIGTSKSESIDQHRNLTECLKNAYYRLSKTIIRIKNICFGRIWLLHITPTVA